MIAAAVQWTMTRTSQILNLRLVVMELWVPGDEHEDGWNNGGAAPINDDIMGLGEDKEDEEDEEDEVPAMTCAVR